MVLNRRKKRQFDELSHRFDNRGLHPNLERRPCTDKYRHLAPGRYYHEEKRKLKGIRYKLSLESEEWSKNLAHRAPFKLKEKAWQRSILGPGWHEVKTIDNIKLGTFTTANRFPSAKTWSTPGPGTYGKNHIPPLRMEEKTRFKYISDIPTFEFDNCLPRSINIHRTYHLPPNIYNKKSFTDEIISKVVSKRGPYDLFTGDRDETSLYGHYSRPKRKWQAKLVNFQSMTERLNNPCNRFKGKFLTCGRDPCERPAVTGLDKVAPNQYNPQELSKPKNVARFPFNSSVLHARPLDKIPLKPPPGRYEQLPKRIFGNGWRSAFLSNTKRGIPLPEKMSWY